MFFFCLLVSFRAWITYRGVMAIDAAPGLRQRRREELVGQVVAIAMRHLGEQGAAQLSLRAVAREIGIAPSALYRYFPSRDDLLTTLIARTFVEIDRVIRAAAERALADHPDDPLTAWIDTTLAYRSWVTAHREDFALVYGTPIPGYAAPEEATREVGSQAGGALFRPLVAALQLGMVDLAAVQAHAAAMSPEMRADMARRGRDRGLHLPEDLAAGLIALGFGAWAKLQGLLAMEVFGHLPPVAPFAEEFFRAESAAIAIAVLAPAPPPGPATPVPSMT